MVTYQSNGKESIKDKASVKDKALVKDEASVKPRGQNREPISMRARVEVYFMPEANLEDLLTYHILRAKKSIHIAMYSFTHPDVTRALSLAQHKHHVDVQVLLDALAANDISEIDELIKEGIPVRISTGWGKMHHKNCVIDARLVLVGSANYSQASDHRNCEDLILLSSKQVGKVFEDRFTALWERCIPKP